MLQSMGSQRVVRDWVTEQQQEHTDCSTETDIPTNLPDMKSQLIRKDPKAGNN